MSSDPGRPTLDFFISYTSADRAWAEWITWQLEESGYKTILQAWDFRPGSNFLLEMHLATKKAERTIAVLSKSYLASTYAQPEWAAAVAADPTGAAHRLVPVRVEDVQPDGLLMAIVYIDLVGLDTDAAREALLDGLKARGKPSAAPAKPGHARGSPPRRISNVPPVGAHFMGRAALLSQLSEALAQRTPGAAALPVVLHGPPGVGKTQIASSLAAGVNQSHELMWWVRATDQPILLEDFASLARALGLADSDDASTEALIDSARNWLLRSSDWLLVFDGLAALERVEGLIPTGGQGQVVVTTRQGTGLRGVATPIVVEPLASADATAFLTARTGDNDVEAAAELAAALDFLPLALEQAGAYIDEHGLTLGEYRERFERQAAVLLGKGAPAGYPTTLATTWRLAIDVVEETDPAAAELLELLSFVDSERFPLDVLTNAGTILSPSLAAAAADELRLDELVGMLLRHSLVIRQDDTISTHRSLQSICRADLSPERSNACASAALRCLMASMPTDVENPPAWVTVRPLLPHLLAAARNSAQLSPAPVETVPALVTAATYLRARAQPAAAVPLLDRALALQGGQAIAGKAERAHVLSLLGSALWRLGHFERAGTAYREALDIRRSLLPLPSADVADSLDDLGTVLQRQARYGDAADLHTEALSLRASLGGGAPPQRWVTLSNLALAQWRLGRMADARITLQTAQGELQASGVDDPLARAFLASNAAAVAASQGDLTRAVDDQQNAYDTLSLLLGPDHTKTAAAMTNLSASLFRVGLDLERADVLLEHALDVFEESYGFDNPAVALVLNNLGLVYYSQDQLELARSAHERSLAIRQAAFGSAHPAVSVALLNLGVVLAEMGQLDAAVEHQGDGVRLASAALGPFHRDVGEGLFALGWTHARHDDRAGAVSCWSDALPILTASYVTSDPRPAHVRALIRGETAPQPRSGALACGQERYSALFFTS